MSLGEWANVATIVGVIAAVLGFIWVMVDYRRNATLRRAEHFARIRKGLLESATLSRIKHLVQTDDPALAQEKTVNRVAFLCFFEEADLLLKAKLIKPQLAYYMFGHDAIRCDDSKNFWSKPEFPKETDHWALFFEFVQFMRGVKEYKGTRPWRLKDLKL